MLRFGLEISDCPYASRIFGSQMTSDIEQRHTKLLRLGWHPSLLATKHLPLGCFDVYQSFNSLPMSSFLRGLIILTNKCSDGLLAGRGECEDTVKTTYDPGHHNCCVPVLSIIFTVPTYQGMCSYIVSPSRGGCKKSDGTSLGS